MKFGTVLAAVLLAEAAPAAATVTIDARPPATEIAPARAPESTRDWLALVIPALVIGGLLIGRGKPRAPQSVTA